eukprot:SAG31_NODE_8_length_42345_cov_10.980992_7_plen_373_part_00
MRTSSSMVLARHAMWSPIRARAAAALVMVAVALHRPASSTGLKYLSYYTYGPQLIAGYPPINGSSYFLPGTLGNETGSNLANAGHDLQRAARIYAEHGVPSLFSPSGWYRCGNRTSPLADGWMAQLEADAAAVAPFVQNKTVAGIFYGDEISCTCNIPFWAVDSATSFFRGLLESKHACTGLIYATNECMNTMGCPPPPQQVCPGCCGGPNVCGDGGSCPGCVTSCGVRNATHGFEGYWPTVPAALDYVSVDTYLPGAAEPKYARRFYESFIYPKLLPHQKVWAIPGLMAAIEPAESKASSLAKSVNDTLFVEKMEAYMQWTIEDARMEDWMPFHFYNRMWAPTPASGSWGAISMPLTLQWIEMHRPRAITF